MGKLARKWPPDAASSEPREETAASPTPMRRPGSKATEVSAVAPLVQGSVGGGPTSSSPLSASAPTPSPTPAPASNTAPVSAHDRGQASMRGVPHAVGHRAKVFEKQGDLNMVCDNTHAALPDCHTKDDSTTLNQRASFRPHQYARPQRDKPDTDSSSSVSPTSSANVLPVEEKEVEAGVDESNAHDDAEESSPPSSVASTPPFPKDRESNETTDVGASSDRGEQKDDEAPVDTASELPLDVEAGSPVEVLCSRDARTSRVAAEAKFCEEVNHVESHTAVFCSADEGSQEGTPADPNAETRSEASLVGSTSQNSSRATAARAAVPALMTSSIRSDANVVAAPKPNSARPTMRFHSVARTARLARSGSSSARNERQHQFGTNASFTARTYPSRKQEMLEDGDYFSPCKEAPPQMLTRRLDSSRTFTSRRDLSTKRLPLSKSPTPDQEAGSTPSEGRNLAASPPSDPALESPSPPISSGSANRRSDAEPLPTSKSTGKTRLDGGLDCSQDSALDSDATPSSPDPDVSDDRILSDESTHLPKRPASNLADEFDVVAGQEAAAERRGSASAFEAGSVVECGEDFSPAETAPNSQSANDCGAHPPDEEPEVAAAGERYGELSQSHLEQHALCFSTSARPARPALSVVEEASEVSLMSSVEASQRSGSERGEAASQDGEGPNKQDEGRSRVGPLASEGRSKRCSLPGPIDLPRPVGDVIRSGDASANEEGHTILSLEDLARSRRKKKKQRSKQARSGHSHSSHRRERAVPRLSNDVVREEPLREAEEDAASETTKKDNAPSVVSIPRTDVSRGTPTVQIHVEAIQERAPAIVVWKYKKNTYFRTQNDVPRVRALRGFYADTNTACTQTPRNYYGINVVKLHRVRVSVEQIDSRWLEELGLMAGGVCEPLTDVVYRVSYNNRGNVRSVFDLTVVVHRSLTKGLIPVCARLRPKKQMHVVGDRFLGQLALQRPRAAPTLMCSPQLFVNIPCPSVGMTTRRAHSELGRATWETLKEMSRLDWAFYERLRRTSADELKRAMLDASIGA